MKQISFFLLFFSVFLFSASADELSREKEFLSKAETSIVKDFQKRKNKYDKEIKNLEKKIESIKKEINSFKNGSEENDKIKKIENYLIDEASVPAIEKKEFSSYFKEFFSGSDIFNRFLTKDREVIMLGYLGGVYKNKDKYGYVCFNNNKLSYYPEKYKNKELLQDIFMGSTSRFPVCAGKGIKMESGVFADTIQYLKSGGIMIYPIILTGFAGFCLVLLQGVLLFYRKIPKLSVENYFFGKIEKNEKPDIKIKRYPSLNLFYTLVEKKKKTRISSDTAESLIEKEISRLEKYNPTIGVLAGISPLLGLLGTVTGMIMTFSAAGGEGAAKAATMAEGISQALVTTQIGLAIALPLM
ncbi:MAG: MotA/TolQ/ExbB proton channel family protein, partial [Thermodesulfobacteriota bacterium]